MIICLNINLLKFRHLLKLIRINASKQNITFFYFQFNGALKCICEIWKFSYYIYFKYLTSNVKVHNLTSC